MNKKSHVDINKINELPKGRAFEYKDVVSSNLPDNEHVEDGKVFKTEVENGLFSGVIVENDKAHTTVKYKKI